MNRFAILKDIPPPPFKDDIAKEISEANSKYGTPLSLQLLEQQRALNSEVAERQVMASRALRAAAMNPNPEELFLTVRMPSGEEYAVRRDQIHIHQPRTLFMPLPGQTPNYELHLNLPDNLASRIYDELHHPEIRLSARNYENQRRQYPFERL